ncbi:hypothetical protein BGZ65_009714, partial [Modicella reniformis]
MSVNGQPSEPIKSEPKRPSVHRPEDTDPRQYEQTHDLSAPQTDDDLDDRMDYADETPVHPLAPVPQSSLSPTSTAHSHQMPKHSHMSSVQPQQHQQLLKLKTEHGFSHPPSSMSTPDIVMTNDDSDVPSIGNSRRASSEANMGSSEAIMDDDLPLQDQNPRLPHMEKESLNTSRAQTPMNGNLTVDTPATAAGTTAPSSSRRPSLRTMTATLPRSALQEETIALFKQYRNLIPCAKCFCRNTIQRDGMSDGNLRFKCRPPVSMSLICNKSYSESKIRNMIAGVVYGHSLPDSNTPSSTTSPGDNVLALAPPPAVKSSRRSSTKAENSPRITSEMTPERMQRLDEDQDAERDGEAHHTMDTPAVRRISQAQMFQQQQHGGSIRCSSAQPRGSMMGDEPMMMDYDEPVAHLPPSNHSGHLQVPGTPPLDSEESRYRPRTVYGHQGRSITPTGPVQQPPQTASRQIHKLHHSHSHPNIGQVRHQQFLEQQEREHRGSVAGMGHPNQQQPRAIPRQITRRDSSQHLGGAERRSSQPSPVMNPVSTKYEALSPALSSSPRSSPGHESMHHQQGSIPGP